jgi:hypothetical protein
MKPDRRREVLELVTVHGKSLAGFSDKAGFAISDKRLFGR